jgi:hypothetical protein
MILSNSMNKSNAPIPGNFKFYDYLTSKKHPDFTECLAICNKCNKNLLVRSIEKEGPFSRVAVFHKIQMIDGLSTSYRQPVGNQSCHSHHGIVDF